MSTKHIKNAIRLLENARNIIEQPNRWIKNYYAIDNNGKSVDSSCQRACRFCSVGALLNAASRAQQQEYEKARGKLAFVMDGDITVSNDDKATKQKHVAMAFDFAILMAKDELKGGH